MRGRALALLVAALVLAGCGSATQQNEPTLPRPHANSNQYPDDAR